MKELSIEEKAKAYDEALKVLHKYDGANIMFTQDLKEEMFPELKESEDEKIRKELITHCRNTRCVTEEGAERIVKWISWLEKQGNLMKALQISNAEIGELIEKNYYLKEQLEKQGNNMGISEATKQKLEDNLNKALEKETPESCNKFLDEQGEQKPAEWDDEKKELKKTSSELDEVSYQVGIKRVLENTESYGLTKRDWKPSDEQMERLKGTINSLPHQEVLYSLYQDLKKLKG